MELIRISDRKLKIMLTPKDMRLFELNPEQFGQDSAQMHRSFRLLLTEVRRQTDFDADDSHLSVQYFPSREGGCEMFICNLREEKEKKERTESFLPVFAPCTELRPYKKKHGSFRRECAYRFANLAHLLAACRRLFGQDCICESSAFRDEGGDYFLFLTVFSITPYTTPEQIEFITEYGTPENALHLKIYIREHGSVVCHAVAIATLASLA